MTGIRQDKIARFNEKHDLSINSQFKQLVEELGELAEVLDEDDGRFTFFERVSTLGETAERLNREHAGETRVLDHVSDDSFVDSSNESTQSQSSAKTDELAEELADVVFVARSIAEMCDINLTAAVNSVADENLQKDESTEGAKVTKAGLGDTCGLSVNTDDPAIEERLHQLRRDIDDEQVNVKLQRAIELWNRDERETTYGVTDD